VADKWYYNSNSGVVAQYNTVTEWPALHSGTGWHGPFNAKQDALNYYTTNQAKNPGWKAPTDSLTTGLGNAVATGTSNVTSGITSGLGLNDDEIRSWLVRIGEILLGVVLVAVGVAKLTGTTNVVASAVKARI
jgi:hypothetical protein